MTDRKTEKMDKRAAALRDNLRRRKEKTKQDAENSKKVNPDKDKPESKKDND